MFVTSIIIGVTTVLIIKWYRDRRHKQETFHRMGVPGPTPSLLMGNLDIVLKKGYSCALEEWTNNYGKIFGYFEGEDAVLVISEPEYVKEIAIKQFNKFHSHRLSPVNERRHEKRNIFFAEGDRWKRLRTIASPTFTAKRMKEMSPLINKSVDDLLDLFDEKCKDGKPFDIHGEFGRLTVDVIASCAFGIDTGSIRDENSVFLVESKKVFEEFELLSIRLKLALAICLIFPGFTDFLRRWNVFDGLCSFVPQWIVNMSNKVLKDRQINPTTDNRVDFLNLLLKGRQHGIQEEADELLSYPGGDPNQSFKPLTDDEMAAQIAVVMLAGYETTSTALGFAAYELALNPDVQEKLQAEIDEHFPQKKIRPDYITVNQLPYMDVVMKEILRIHPIGPLATSRKCFETTKVGDITIPKDMLIQMNMEDLHFRPDLWGKHDPKKFVPERFLEDCQDAHSKMAWIPFGVGPRICLGMRFAQMEYKIALARTLKYFNFKKCSETKVPLQTKKNGFNGPAEGVFITLERRE